MYTLLPWQAHALDRILELDAAGQLRFRTCIVTVGRQQGKSILLRALAWWRIHQAERFGEPQQLIHVANVGRTAMEIWRPAARHTVDTYGRKYAKFGMGTLEIDLTDAGHGRWLVQAGDHNAAIGYSPSMGIIDEAWNVPRVVLDDGMRPAMSERLQPQIVMFSTAGDSGSDLLQTYREQALQDPKGDILLLEWSAPEDAPYDEPASWRWATPNWSPQRERAMASALKSMPESRFRVQYLNQWVQSVDGWLPGSVWAACADPVAPTGNADAVCVEVSPDGGRFAVVAAWHDGDGGVIVRSATTPSSARVWDIVEGFAPRVLLLTPPVLVHYRGKRRPTPVGTTELGRHLLGVGQAIHDGRVKHDPADITLSDDVGRAVATATESGLRLSVKKSTGPTEAARAMVQVVGELLRPTNPRPMIRAG